MKPLRGGVSPRLRGGKASASRVIDMGFDPRFSVLRHTRDLKTGTQL